MRALASVCRRRGVPVGFSFMIALIVLVESFVVSREIDFVHP